MNKILEYQKIDGDLLQIERKIKVCTAQTIVDRENNIANNVRNEMKDLDKKSEELLKEFTALRKIMDDNIKNVEILEKQKTEMQDKSRVKKLYDNIKNVNNNLVVIENRMKTLTSQIDGVLKSFNSAKKKLDNSKDKKKRAQHDLDNVTKKHEKRVEELSAKLATIAKDTDAKLLEIYKRLRDAKYPPFVQVTDEDGKNRCSGCKSIIPVGRMDTLKSSGRIECENCHRVIYLPDKF